MEILGFTAKPRMRVLARWSLISIGWAAVVLVFASQWYAYDVSREAADPFVFYVWWSWYLWAVITPSVLWLSRRYPIDAHTWQRAIPLHIAASVMLTVIQLSVESYLGWLRQIHESSFKAALRHYFSQHTQPSLLTYWVLVAATQFYRIYDQARKQQIQAAQFEARLAEAQLDMLRMQLQPHFLFNTLQAATTLVHEDPDGAEDILLRLSELLRVSLDELHIQEIPLAREIEFLEHYIGIQERRFGDRLRFHLQIEEDVLTCSVPSLILQPLVENAVRHGIGKYKESDEITIRARRNAAHLNLEVQNVTSKLTSTLDNLLKQGRGLANSQARLRQLYGDQQSLELFNLDPRGVCVALVLPLRLSSAENLQRMEPHT